MKFNFFFFIIIILTIVGCKKEEIPPKKTEQNYLFLGHIYETPNTIDHRVIPFIAKKQYEVGIDQIWLGGDICSETTKEHETLEYLDTIFNLSSPSTNWTLGNHDIRNGNIEWITEKTNRPIYYTTHFNDITLVVWYNHVFKDNVYDTTLVNDQFNMIKNVCDTIQSSSHLIILSHFITWQNIPNLTSPTNYANANHSYIGYQLNPLLSFSKAIYPLLREVKQRA